MSREPAYRIRSLVHAYNGKPVLDIPELDLPAAEITAIAGPNGSGKSTLLQILALLLTPVSGSVLLDGVDIVRNPDVRLRRRVTLVHQKPFLFSTTVRNNIWYGLRASRRMGNGARRNVEAALGQLDLAALADRPARKLSGGEAQRVVLARALVLDTPILLLDEPTSFLDDEARFRVLDLVQSVHESRGATVVIATHDLSLIGPLAHRVLHLDSGNISGDLR